MRSFIISNLIFVFVLCNPGGDLYSQSNVLSGGGEGEGNGGFVSYSLGQLDYFHTDDQTSWINLGVQQPYKDQSDIDVAPPSECFLYPNPSSGIFYLDRADIGFNTFSYQLYDLIGRMQKEGKDLPITSPLDLEDLNDAVYEIIITSESNEVWKCKIVIVTP